MKILLENISLLYDVQCVCLLFFPRVAFSEDDGKYLTAKADEAGIFVSFTQNGKIETGFYPFVKEYDYFRTAVKLSVYDILCKVTKKKSPWGIITGIRPATLLDKLRKENGDDAGRIFAERYRVSPEKISLCEEVLEGRRRAIEENGKDNASIYISIPFCPSRCKYCSFVSSSTEKEKHLLPDYISFLCDEIREKRDMIIADGKIPSTLYVGGGTPSVLDGRLLKKLLISVEENFLSRFPIKEFTFEAGRADTVSEEKLKILEAYGTTRISVNPQTLNDDVLLAIGRKHTSADFFRAYDIARKFSFIINTDIIAGLPSDYPESFYKTAEDIFSLSPDNITVHTLYLKRSADFGAVEEVLSVKEATKKSGVEKMLSYLDGRRREEKYFPYYLYKQKNTVENMENVGYSKYARECFYNIYMMDDIHDIYGIGAGAVSKRIDPETGRAFRKSNTKFAYNYIKERTVSES